MKRLYAIIMLFVILSIVGIRASAHDIEVANADGVIIYYNYINDAQDLVVTFKGKAPESYSDRYTGIVTIPEEVTYMNRTRKVTNIGGRSFYLGSWGSVLLIIFYVDNLDVGSWGVKNDV